MKIVSFSGGLGNQLFEYLFYLDLSRRYGKVYGHYRKSRLSCHNGLEIQRWFDVRLPKATVGSDLLANCYKMLMKLRLLHETSEDTYTDGRKGFFFEGYWQGRQYYDERDITTLRLLPLELDGRNSELARELIGNVNSVALHVRRGDYLSNEHLRQVLGSVCNDEYYRLALQQVFDKVERPTFYVFSDDITWCRNHFSGYDNMVFVDWNRQEDSFYDLYLMTLCRHHVIANSTFSYWGARLSRHADGITIYPERWLRGWDAPKIFPDEWTGIYV